MLVSSRRMLNDAQKGGYAVCAFNFENMEMCKAITETAERLHSPVILQTTPATVEYASLELLASMAYTLANRVNIPVALHLDHGCNRDLALRAIAIGYTSLMTDGSRLPLEENIILTAETVRMASARGIPVEGELGNVGGKHDAGGAYTDPKEALRFVSEAGVSSLAVAIGTAPGIYAEKPNLDIRRLAAIKKALRDGHADIPLVLHGASGLSDDDLKACIREGICKVNFATELRRSYTAAVLNVLENPDVYDPKKYGRAAAEAVSETAESRILACGSAGMAS